MGERKGMSVFAGVLPQVCLVCGGVRVEIDSSGVCLACQREIERTVTHCEVARVADGVPVYAAAPYQGVLVELIAAVKRGGYRRPLRFIAERVFIPWLTTHEGSLCPVPASKQGRRARGFDQMIALSRLTSRTLVTPLRRGRGAQQKRLTRVRREHNARSSLFLSRGVPSGGDPLIVVDDVYTTGATLSRAVELLLAARMPLSCAWALCYD